MIFHFNADYNLVDFFKVRSLFKMRLTGTRLHKFLLNTCRKSYLVIVLYIRLFSECSEVKDGMLMVILALKNLYLPLEIIFFRQPEAGYI